MAEAPLVADRFFPGLFSVLRVLQPCLPNLVLVGGWVPYLMARATPAVVSHEQLFTRDIDLALPRHLHADARLIDTLLLEAGLECEFRSLSEPPVVAFVGSIGETEVEVEFLTDEPGSRERVVKIGGKLHAQTLHYTRILLDHTATVSVTGPAGDVLTVRIPTQAAFVLNKGLTFVQRKTREKKAKDLYYIFEVLDSQAAASAGLVEEVARLGRRYPSWYRRFKKDLSEAFGHVDAEGVRLVVSQRPGAAFLGMSDEQLGQYVLATFADFLRALP